MTLYEYETENARLKAELADRRDRYETLQAEYGIELSRSERFESDLSGLEQEFAATDAENVQLKAALSAVRDVLAWMDEETQWPWRIKERLKEALEG